jgi:hypothetical protein
MGTGLEHNVYEKAINFIADNICHPVEYDLTLGINAC